MVSTLPQWESSRAFLHALSQTLRTGFAGAVFNLEETKLLKPGESFEYTSWTQLATPHGSMHGTFFCMTEDAHPFDAPVPEFSLALPSALH